MSTWEEVLASFEATADAAEQLLRPGGPPPAEVVAAAEPEYDPWQLALPPLPQALVERAHAVRARHEALSARLRKSSAQLRQQEKYLRSSLTGPNPSSVRPRSIFIDQKA